MKTGSRGSKTSSNDSGTKFLYRVFRRQKTSQSKLGVRHCKSKPSALITTMIDYYGLPKDAPGKATASGDIYNKVSHIEREVEKDMGELRNLIFNLVMHEYEGLLFTDTSAFNHIPNINPSAITVLQATMDEFETPEHINDSFNTAPSKRIKAVFPMYRKPLHGIIVAKHIGLDAIAAACPHFREWLSKIISQGNT